jgi:hypothetical protein
MLLLSPVWGRQAGQLWGQISPGPLARPHEELEGTLKCTRCHGGGKDAMPAQCTSCHRDIAWLAERGRGYHGAASTKGTPCAACHPDHAGAAFDLIKWPDGSPQRFDHRRAGWTLEQSHRTLECADCHAEKNRVSPSARLAAGPAPDRWTGLERDCVSCHTDPHRAALGTECTKCHDAGKWKVTPGFSHDSTAYPLTGRHVKVTCAKCHETERLTARRSKGSPTPVYKPVPHASCADCHADPHNGRLGPGCSGCHTTRGFHTIEKDHFDHDRTRFPLKGAHATVRCSSCHRDFSTPALKRPGFASCQACHADPHGGSATLAGKPVDCGQCHSVTAFTPAVYTVAQHRNTRYPLEGKHQSVACASCHREETNPALAARWGKARVIIRPSFARCTDCHGDDHGGQLASRPDGGDCAACHRVAGWKPSLFDRTAHARLKLPLEGRHAEIGCRACHGSERKGLPPIATTGLGKARFLFRVTQTDCAACHVDPHLGRFAKGEVGGKMLACTACHDARAFRPSTVDVAAHQGYGFPLEGAHRAIPCVACHAEMKAPRARTSTLIAAGVKLPELRFQASRVCADCHRTPHGNQFAGRPDQGRCDACHTLDSFIPAGRFDHNRDTRFSLKGAHEQVPCNRCHLPDRAGGAPGRLVYRPVSGKCEACHAGKEAR